MFLQLLDPAVRVDPYPLYRRILAQEPVAPSPFGGVVLARYADCAAVLRDRRASTDETHAGLDISDYVADRPFLFMDPPDHTRLRRLVTAAFTPRVVEALRPTIQRWVDELLDAAAAKGHLELIAGLAYPLPVRVICELLGVPVADEARFRRWSADLARSLDPPPTIPDDVARRMNQSFVELTAYFDDLIAQRRSDPRDDLLSALISAEESGDQLTTGELNATCRLLLIAGHETTVILIANGLLALLRHPDQLDRLREDQSLAGPAVEEVLRYDPPVQMAARWAAEPLTVAGFDVARGHPLILLLPAASRDPAVVDDPDRFDIGRPDRHHLAFGAGMHFCLGAPLARLEGQIALATLARRLVDPRLAVDPPPYKEQIILRGPERVDVAFAALRDA